MKKVISKTKSAKKTAIYQIDQSIKIENTQKASYICIANGKTIVCSISAKDKRELKLFFRELERPLIFKIFTFSVLCAKAIVETKAQSVMIDKEYLGHEIDINSFITQILKIWKYPQPNLTFALVGKNSPAHIKGYKAYKKEMKDSVINANEVLILYNLINKG